MTIQIRDISPTPIWGKLGGFGLDHGIATRSKRVRLKVMHTTGRQVKLRLECKACLACTYPRKASLALRHHF